MKEPILITGAARSGTSMVAGVINLCGAFGGNMAGANRNNQKGMFENVHVRQNIVRPYLKKLGVDSKAQYPLPNVNALQDFSELRAFVKKTFIKQGYTGGDWMYKCPKMCLHWPVWHAAFPDAKWVIVRRKSEGIVNSCIRTGFMNAFDRSYIRKEVGVRNVAEGWQWWVRQHGKRFVEMFQADLNVKQVWPHRMIEGDFSELKGIIGWLGLEWKEQEVREFIEPKLYNSKGV
jgi:hypothetical protein